MIEIKTRQQTELKQKTAGTNTGWKKEKKNAWEKAGAQKKGNDRQKSSSSSSSSSSSQTAGRTEPRVKPRPTVKQFTREFKATGKRVNAAAVKAASSGLSKAATQKHEDRRSTEQRVTAGLSGLSKAAARKASKKAVKTSAKIVIKLAKKAAALMIRAVKGIVMAIAGGGWIFLVILVIAAAISAFLSSPFAILFGGGADNTPTVSEVIQTLNDELTDKIDGIKRDAGQADKVRIFFNGYEGNAFIDNWPDMLAVYSVKTNMDPDNPADLCTFDNGRIQKLRDVFWDMNSVTYKVSDPTPEATPQTPDSPDATETPEQQKVLTIWVNSKYWEDMIRDYGFSEEQVKMLKEMMSAKNAALLMQLVSTAMGDPAKDWSGIIDAPEGGMPIPLYMQGDFTETVCYYNGEEKSVSTSGCGAASVSMVIAYLTGNTNQTPYTLFKWAYDNGYYAGDGLGHACLSKMAKKYGVKGTWIANDAQLIAAALRAGHPVIAHMGPGIFTDEGHYIVLRGITEDGHVIVNDPNSKNRSRYAYLLTTVVKQAKKAECFMVCEGKN